MPPKRKRSDSEDISTVASKHQKSANESSESKSLFYDGGNFTLSENPKTGEGCLTLFTDGYPSNSDSSGSEEDEHTETHRNSQN